MEIDCYIYIINLIYFLHIFGDGGHTWSLEEMGIMVFKKENGFSSIRMAGDFEMWLRLSQKFNVVCFPSGVVEVGRYEHREMNDFYSDAFEQFKYPVIALNYLLHANCPLNNEIKISLIKELKKNIGRRMLKTLIYRKFDTYQKMQAFSDFSLIKAISFSVI